MINSILRTLMLDPSRGRLCLAPGSLGCHPRLFTNELYEGRPLDQNGCHASRRSGYVERPTPQFIQIVTSHDCPPYVSQPKRSRYHQGRPWEIGRRVAGGARVGGRRVLLQRRLLPGRLPAKPQDHRVTPRHLRCTARCYLTNNL